jgi:beta-lactamase class C
MSPLVTYLKMPIKKTFLTALIGLGLWATAVSSPAIMAAEAASAVKKTSTAVKTAPAAKATSTAKKPSKTPSKTAATGSKSSGKKAPPAKKASSAKSTQRTVKKGAAKTKTRAASSLALAQGAAAINSFKPDPNKPHYQQFEDYVRKVIAPNVPGVAVAVVAEGQVQVLAGFGVREVGSDLPVTPDTVFRLASVSKTMASGAAAIAVRDRLLSWDTPVVSKVPELEFSNSRYGQLLTLKDVLAQRSGFPKHTYTHLIEEFVPYPVALQRLKYVNFACPPKRCYSYQNVVYSLSGNMIQAATGKTYEAYTVEKLFRPLNMQTASLGLAAFQATSNRALPHVWRGRGWSRTASIDHNYYSVGPAAGANASIRDMSQWILAQLGRKPDVLPEHLLDDMQQKITPNTLGESHYASRDDVSNTHYGLGWRIFDFGPYRNFAHHGGWVQGYRAEVVFNRELQIGMAFLTNSETKLARNIIFKYLDLFQEDRRKNKAALATQ